MKTGMELLINSGATIEDMIGDISLDKRAEAIELAKLSRIMDHMWLEDQYDRIERLVSLSKKLGEDELRKTFNYCPRCGKQMPHEHNFVHTCTPPNWNRSGY